MQNSKIKVMKIMVLLNCLFIIGAPTSFADSIWKKNLTSPYSSKQVFQKGDVVMVLVVETTSASQRAGTDTVGSDNFTFNSQDQIRKLNSLLGSTNTVVGAAGNTYKGAGSTTRSNNVLAAVAVTVTNVMPNGNLKIHGTHKVSVNEETQDIVIDGTVRPKDITDWNTVYSYQIAEAIVQVKGSGSVQEASAPGLIFRLFNLLF